MKKKDKSRGTIYMTVAVLLLVTLSTAVIFARKPPVQRPSVSDFIPEMKKALNAADSAVPDGFELDSAILIDINNDGKLDGLKEYTNGEKYIIKLYFIDEDYNAAPAPYDLMGDINSEQCLIGTESFSYEPSLYIKNEDESSMSIKRVIIHSDRSENAEVVRMQNENGTNRYYSNGSEISEYEFNEFMKNFRLCHLCEAENILVEESFFKVQ